MFSEISEYEVSFRPSSNGSLKQFYRRMEKIFESLEQATTTISVARSFIINFLDQLAPILAVSRIHLYECLSGSPELIELWGTSKNFEQIKLEVVPPELPWVGGSKDCSLAVLPVGDDTTMLMVFFADRANNRETEDDYQSYFHRAFSSIHYALVQNLRRLGLQDEFYQAKAIQLSLLPTHHPTFVEFDISSECVPAQSVGGDMYDYQFFARGSLAVAITDAAGHGLPAALQARDVITGFRMGVRSEMGVAEIAEKLNYVIHQAGLSSRFVSLVIGELWRNGTFKYVNAGHPRPLLLTERSFTELNSGGTILGPLRDSDYVAGRVYLPPGGMLVLYSDGILEHTDPDGVEFGMDRIKGWMLESQGQTSRLSVQELFRRISVFGEGVPLKDDATVVVIQRRQ